MILTPLVGYNGLPKSPKTLERTQIVADATLIHAY